MDPGTFTERGRGSKSVRRCRWWLGFPGERLSVVRVNSGECDHSREQHHKSILHLDLKPGNVLLTWDDGKLVCDDV